LSFICRINQLPVCAEINTSSIKGLTERGISSRIADKNIKESFSAAVHIKKNDKAPLNLMNEMCDDLYGHKTTFPGVLRTLKYAPSNKKRILSI
jgi:hypothetical protein